MRVGFVGLGIMGRPMAANLLKAGHSLAVLDRKAIPEEILAQGASSCTSGEEVARRSEVVITMVPDTPDVAAALFDPGGVAAGLTPGKIVVDMSSISPIDTKAFAARIEALG
jgi:2-hydroxy-3-oxopropionate reductase